MRHAVRALVKASTYMYTENTYTYVHMYVYIYVNVDPCLPLDTRTASALLLHATLFCAPHCIHVCRCFYKGANSVACNTYVARHTVYMYVDAPCIQCGARAASALLLRATLFAPYPRIRSTYIYTHIYIYMYHSPRVLQALLCAITTCVCTHLYICMYRLPRALRARCCCGPRCSPPPLEQASEREHCHPHYHPQTDPRSSWSARRRKLPVVVLLLRAARLLRILKSQFYSCFRVIAT